MIQFPFFNLFKKETKEKPELLTLGGTAALNDAPIVPDYGGLIEQGLIFQNFDNDDGKLDTYRNIAGDYLIALAIDEIVNSMVVFKENKLPIHVSFINEKEVSPKIKTAIENEFNEILKLMNFRKNGYQFVKDWYIDGKLLLHKIVDKDNNKKGISKIIQIDPKTLKKIKVVDLKNYEHYGLIDLNKTKEYYAYKPKLVLGSQSFYNTTMMNALVSAEAIASSDSGIYKDGVILSYLDRTIIPFNNIKLLEQSMIIYRVARAPERKAFYVDVNGIPPTKTEEYMEKQMNRFRTKKLFDPKTGKLDGHNAVMSIVEDYWLPRRNGTATEIQTIEGGTMLQNIDDVNMFYDQFIQSLNVPKNRLTSDASNSIFGNGAEITRDEYKFLRFIDKLQQQFSVIFYDLLKTQLILKGVADEEDWNNIENNVQFIFENDNAFYMERSLTEVSAKLQALSLAEPYVNDYFDKEWVLKNILFMSDDETAKYLKLNPPKENQKNE